MRGRSRPLLATAGTQESRRPSFRRAGLVALLAAVALAATPGIAAADGPTAPVATDYLARDGLVLFDNPDGCLICVFKRDTALCEPGPGATAQPAEILA